MNEQINKLMVALSNLTLQCRMYTRVMHLSLLARLVQVQF